MKPVLSHVAGLLVAVVAFASAAGARQNGGTTVLRTVYQLSTGTYAGAPVIAVAEDQDLRAIAESFERSGPDLYIQIVKEGAGSGDAATQSQVLTVQVLHANGEQLVGVTIDEYPERTIHVYSKSYAVRRGLLTRPY